jgi:ribonuclease Z
MSTVKPRHAIAYHSWTWHDVYDQTLEAVRETYDGPLTIATDLMVWNVTDDQVVVREVIASEDVQPTGTSDAYRRAERGDPEEALDDISEDINAGKWEGYTPPPIPEG